jgi:hypothetical protein
VVTTTLAPTDFPSLPELDVESDRPTSVTSSTPPALPDQGASEAPEAEGCKLNATLPELLVVGGFCIVFGLFLGCSVQYISVSKNFLLFSVLTKSFSVRIV